MTAPDAPPVEPLTLEEALARIGERGYTLLVRHRKDAPEYVLCDMYSAFARGSFGHWKDAVEAVLGVPVVPHDDTADLTTAYMVGFEKGKDAARDNIAELVEAVEAYLAAEDHLDATMDDRYEVSDTRDAAEEVFRRQDELRQALSRVRGES